MGDIIFSIKPQKVTNVSLLGILDDIDSELQRGGYEEGYNKCNACINKWIGMVKSSRIIIKHKRRKKKNGRKKR